METNENIVWVKKNVCKPLEHCEEGTLHNCSTNTYDTKLKGYKFTEVFDTPNFPDNSAVSSYMSLVTKLTNKESVCLITYGYSGTGKSFTLFGSSNSQGLLQSTLNGLDGIDQLYFRTYELYGRGFNYNDYWKKTTGQYNYVYAYNTHVITS